MRKVIVSDYIKNHWTLQEIGEALFHQFGVNYEGADGNLTTAIVEWPDGRIENIPVERVRFINDDKPTKILDLHDEQVLSIWKKYEGQGMIGLINFASEIRKL